MEPEEEKEPPYFGRMLFSILMISAYGISILFFFALFYGNMTPGLNMINGIYLRPYITNVTMKDTIASMPCILHVGYMACPNNYRLVNTSDICKHRDECTILRTMNDVNTVCASEHPICEISAACLTHNLEIMGMEWYKLYTPVPNYGENVKYMIGLTGGVLILCTFIMSTIFLIQSIMSISGGIYSKQEIDTWALASVVYIIICDIGISIVTFLGIIAWPIMYRYYDNLPLYTSHGDHVCFLSDYELYHGIYDMYWVSILTAVMGNGIMLTMNIVVGWGLVACVFPYSKEEMKSEEKTVDI